MKTKFFILAALATFAASCNDKDDELYTDPIDYNKTSFMFPQEGGSDSLYVRGFGALQLTHMMILDKENERMVADVQFANKETVITDSVGNVCAKVEYDKDNVKHIATDDYDIRLLYDDNKRSTNTYLLTAHSTPSVRKELILTGKASHGNGPGITIK